MATDNINQDEEQNKEKEPTIENIANKGNSNGTNSSEPSQKISVELYKYKTLIDALENPHNVIRVVFTIFFLGILLFLGITIITLSIKRLYPYSDITTNGLGATTIKSEKNEVSYWLFNTAIPWANSGIAVDKGDIITIRASGKSHTAIHHLYEAAVKNTTNRNNWVGGEGEPDKFLDTATYFRRRFRIFPDMRSGALLMQVVENDKLFDNPDDGNPDNFYFIGKERQHIYINNSGTLYFAVNDIILNRPTIASMMWENIRQKYCNLKKSDPQIKQINAQIEKKGLNNVVSIYQEIHLKSSDKPEDRIVWDSIKALFETEFEQEVSDTTKSIGIMNLGHTLLPGDSKCECELSYYYGKDDENKLRKTVWFDDNIGSFLIVVEKSK